MLDEPDTFTLANEAVTQFRSCRRPTPAWSMRGGRSKSWRRCTVSDAELNELRQRSDALLAQETHLRTVVVQLRAESATADLAAGERRVDALTHEQNRPDAAGRDCADARERARSRGWTRRTRVRDLEHHRAVPGRRGVGNTGANGGRGGAGNARCTATRFRRRLRPVPRASRGDQGRPGRVRSRVVTSATSWRRGRPRPARR